MASLKVMQAYADKCAGKLLVGTLPVLRWATPNCKVGRNYAHCHIRDSEYPRGVICLNRRAIPRMGVKAWHHTIGHEVAHLAVKSNHCSATFARRMVTLGVANYYDRNHIKREKHIRKMARLRT